MPTVAVGDMIHVKAFCVQTPQLSVNNFKFRVDTAPVNPNLSLTGIANGYRDVLSNFYTPFLTNSAYFYGVGIEYWISPGPFSTLAYSDYGPLVGTAGNSALPSQACAIWAWGIFAIGRQSRNRIYFPFMDESLTDTAFTIDAATQLAMLLNVNSLVNGVSISGGGGDPDKTFSSHLMHGQSDNPAGWVTPEWWTVRLRLATQKRRGAFGKPNNPPF